MQQTTRFRSDLSLLPSPFHRPAANGNDGKPRLEWDLIHWLTMSLEYLDAYKTAVGSHA